MANPAIATQLATDSKGNGSTFTLGATPASAKAGTTVIGVDALFRGDIKARGDIIIAGSIEGEVSSDTKIVIAAGGSVTGRILAPEVVIEGRLTGDATASKSLSILKSAEVHGDVTTPVIMIEPGATFVGRCSMPEESLVTVKS